MTETGDLRLRVEDLQVRPRRFRSWLRAHPVHVAVWPALLACTPLALTMLLSQAELSWWGALSLPLVCLALVFRKRAPLTVLLVVATLCTLSPLVSSWPPSPVFPVAALAVFTLAAERGLGWAASGYVMAIIITAVATVPNSLAGERSVPAFGIDPFTIGALLLGFWVRQRREREVWLAEVVNERIERAALAERTRIAAEMHDEVAHSLTVVISLAGGATAAWETHPDRARAAVASIAQVGRDSLERMHGVLGVLRGADRKLDDALHTSGATLPTLQELAARFRSAGLPVELCVIGPDPTRLATAHTPAEDPRMRHAVSRIVQEALTNTLRHAADATGATVLVKGTSDDVTLIVTDNGRGLSPRAFPEHPRYRAILIPATAAPSSPRGYGITGIRERAAALGGTAESGPTASGWRTSARLPRIRGAA
ncbi:sensor histidine kinase [Leucobacter luti]|uniref:sensor histidine kinase n=1 Tax=Leucobacter luti TaxID=340320 RepID=UPI001C689E84|nr:histidine kinase [Leucobacter luti]QYM75417.1 hypothetical protein K1X41_12375 [Leucobacter luti]